MVRDFTAAQFSKALARNGFKHEFMFWFGDTTGQTPGVSYSGIFLMTGKIRRRETVAHLITSRAEHVRRASKGR